MFKKTTLLAAVGIGYVLGARAGRERYDAIAGKAQQLWRDPRVQEKAELAREAAKEKADQAREVAKEKTETARDTVKHKLNDDGGTDAAVPGTATNPATSPSSGPLP